MDFQVYPLRQSGQGRPVGIAAPVEGMADEAPEVVLIDSLGEAEERFGGDSLMTALLTAAMENRGEAVWAAGFPAGNADRCREAVELLCRGEAYCVVCGGDGIPPGAAEAAQAQGKLLFAAVPEGQDGAALAASLDCERVILTAPGLRSGSGADVSAAVVGALAAGSPGDSLLGREILGEYQADPLSETEIQALMQAGVTVVENGAVGPEVIRGLTTRAGKGYRSIGAMTALDQVVRLLREALEARFAAGKGRLSLEAVRSQVECELLARQEEELISGWDPPVVTRAPEDPGCCLVSVGIRIRQGAAQIRLLASVGI